MELSAVLTPVPEGGYVAFNPETARRAGRAKRNPPNWVLHRRGRRHE